VNIYSAAHYLKNNMNVKRSNWDNGYYLKIVNMDEIRMVHKNSQTVSTFKKGGGFTTSVYDTEDEFNPSLEDLLAEDYEIYEVI